MLIFNGEGADVDDGNGAEDVDDNADVKVDGDENEKAY